jgi:cell division protein FtsW
MNRILSWVKDMFLHSAAQGAAVMSDKEKAAAEQVNAALVAIRNGGVTGVGFNKSSQKLYYLPEAHTDFIFAIGAEELGLVFSLVLLALYVTFFVCGIIIAARSPDRLGRLLAYGMSFLLFFQVLFNIGVVTKCLPTKGIALPFVSYGGTNLLTALVAVGMLFNVGRQIERQRPRPRSALSPVFEESDA